MDLEKREQDEDQQPFLPEAHEDTLFLEKGPRKATSALKRHIRLILEIAMASVIAALCIRLFLDREAAKPSPIPAFPRKNYTFVEDLRYLNEDMFASREVTLRTLHNWIELSADGRGYVKIDNWESFGLDKPYPMEINSTYTEPVYMVSVFHQLHCLSYIVQAYQNGYEGVELSQEVAHHSAHCFDYLRQSIICAADTSLEGKTDAGPGWGSKHECSDYDTVLAWANTHDVFKYRRNMPDQAIL